MHNHKQTPIFPVQKEGQEKHTRAYFMLNTEESF